jgi:putrescine aminotransferase
VQSRHPESIKEVRGKGLMVGVQLVHEDIGLLTIGGLANRGVIVAYTFNNPSVIRFEPPLIISEEQLDRVVAAFDDALTESERMLEGMVV